MTIERAEDTRPAQPAEPRPPVALSKPLADIDQAWRMASALAQSSIIPNDLRNKASNVLVILMYGQELGFSPMQSLQSIYVVNNRPQMSGQAWIAKVREAGHRHFIACKHCDASPEQHAADSGHRYAADHDPTRCTVTIVRGDTGERHSETFTWADAERAKLAKKDTYLQHPKRMLLWRAVSNCATIICPEVAMGFGAELPDEGPAESTAQALAHAVDARTEAPADDVTDAEVVEPSEDDLAAADEEARKQVLAMQQQHLGEDDDSPLRYSAEEIAEGS